MTRHVLRDGGLRYFEAQLEQLTMDPWSAPSGVRRLHVNVNNFNPIEFSEGTTGQRIDFGVALLEDERHRESHLLGEMARSSRCVILLDQGPAKCVRSADEVTDSGSR